MTRRIPFDEDELRVIGEHIEPANTFLPYRLPKYNTPITPKENFLAAVYRDGPLWFPIFHDLLSIESRTNTDHLARAEVTDGGPLISDEQKGGRDLFGIEWIYDPVINGSMVRPGRPLLKNANEWRDVIRFPDVDGLDWDQCREYNGKFNDTTRSLSVTFQNGLFERMISFMDFGEAAVALIDEDQKGAVHALLDRLCVMYEEMIGKYMEILNIDGVWFHDDWGGQRAPFFSQELCMEMIVPHLKRMADFCHRKGLWFNLHSCGKNEMLVPCMVEAGVDIWFPQSNVDVQGVREAYGDRIMLGIKPPWTDLNATDTEIDAMAQEFVNVTSGGYRECPFVVMTPFLAPDNAAVFLERVYKHSRLALR